MDGGDTGSRPSRFLGFMALGPGANAAPKSDFSARYLDRDPVGVVGGCPFKGLFDSLLYISRLSSRERP